jgi:hypothetical protein
MDHVLLIVQVEHSVTKLICNARHAQLDAPHAIVEQMQHAKHVQQTTYNMVLNVFRLVQLEHILVPANALTVSLPVPHVVIKILVQHAELVSS